MGARRHLKGSDKIWQRLDIGLKCDALEASLHFFMQCPPFHDSFCVFNEILQNFMKKRISVDEMFTISLSMIRASKRARCDESEVC